jgi:hypothetical protein
LRKNRNRLGGQYSLVERDDHYPNEQESGIIFEMEDLELTEPEWDEEEEEEDDEEMLGDDDEEMLDELGEPVLLDDNAERERRSIKVVMSPTALKQSEVNVA